MIGALFSGISVSYWNPDPVMNFGIVISTILFGYLFFMFALTIHALLTPGKKYADATYPISVIIPAYNEEKNIEACLASITASDYPAELMEIIIADDGSADMTSALADKFATANKTHAVHVLTVSHAGKTHALNAAIAITKHPFVVTTDADIIVNKNTFRELVKPFSDSHVAATNSVAVIRHAHGLLSSFQMIEFSLINLIRVSLSKVFDNSIWFFGAVAAYRKDALISAGGFSKDTLAEDMDISLALYKRDATIVTVPTALISTLPCENMPHLFRQRMRWYFGALQALAKHRTLLFRKKRSGAVTFLFFNQIWWTFFSFIFFPLTLYQIHYWYPSAPGFFEGFNYFFRWFSLIGPLYVLWKIPQWGINFINVFSILSGLITLIMILIAMKQYNVKNHFWTVIGVLFYFPYTILLNLTIIFGVFKYAYSKQKYFMNK